jgi:hypothetical protein
MYILLTACWILFNDKAERRSSLAGMPTHLAAVKSSNIYSLISVINYPPPVNITLPK